MQVMFFTCASYKFVMKPVLDVDISFVLEATFVDDTAALEGAVRDWVSRL